MRIVKLEGVRSPKRRDFRHGNVRFAQSFRLLQDRRKAFSTRDDPLSISRHSYPTVWWRSFKEAHVGRKKIFLFS
jgi:hypothetical protein